MAEVHVEHLDRAWHDVDALGVKVEFDVVDVLVEQNLAVHHTAVFLAFAVDLVTLLPVGGELNRLRCQPW